MNLSPKEWNDVYHYKFTIFTPTFNRAHTLSRVYESLSAQTFRNFEWLIVDDGSTDNTRQVIEIWRREAAFPIRYIWQENQGKHVAFNRGVEEAGGELFLPLDSDDACVPHALERFILHWETIPQEQRKRFSAVTSLCRDQHGNLVGSRFPQEVLDSDSLELRYRFKVVGEKWGFQRTDILRRFPFPRLEGARFIPEGVIWSAIARQFKTRFVNEPLRIYWKDNGESSDQLTYRGNPARDALGNELWHRTILNEQLTWFLHSPLQFVRSAVHYARFSFHSGIGLWKQAERLNSHLAKALWAAMLPPALLVYWRDRN